MKDEEKKDEEKKDEEKKEQQTPQEPPKKPYCPPPSLPALQAVDGITFDFNEGLRVKIPKDAKRKYRVVFADMESGLVVYSADVEAGAYIASVKKYCITWQLLIYEQGKLDKPIFQHTLNLKDRDVLLPFPEGALGDTIGWFSYAVEFQMKHQCRLHVVMMPWIREIFEKQYPEITFATKEEAEKMKPYATYRVGLYFVENAQDFQPIDFRKTGLHHAIGYMLGMDIGDYPPKVDLSHERLIKDKYVVIATKASSACKFWNNPSGWREVIQHLKDKGYRVLCIDKEHEVGTATCNYGMPYGAEDYTGNRPLQERIDIIKDADLFIGLSSGLAWLAWCCLPKDRIIMLNTFTEPWNEFDCHHVTNMHACHGCWNDTRYKFEHGNFLWCPRYEHDADKLACGRYLTSAMVNAVVDKALGV